jgi:hypothetical protein
MRSAEDVRRGNKVEAEVKVEEVTSKFLVPFLRQGMPCSNVLLF